MALLAIGTTSLAVGAGAAPSSSSSSSSSSPRRCHLRMHSNFSGLSFSRTETLASGGVFPLSLSATSLAVAAPITAPYALPLPLVYCGRGDKKTAKGKRFRHSFGNCRPRNKNKGRGPPRAPMPPSPPKKDKFDDGEIVKIDIDESLFS